MSTIIALLCLVIATSTAFRVHKNSTRLVEPRVAPEIDLAESLSGAFSARGFSHQWITDDSLYYNDNGAYIKHNIRDNQKTELFRTSDIVDGPYNSFSLSEDENYVLVGYDRKEVFRHSYTSKYKLYSLVSKQLNNVANGDDLQICRWAGSQLVYIKKNNLFVWKNGFDTPLTTTGVPGVIYNGVPDWVYEEEILGVDTAFWVAPDLEKIAFATFNDAKVEKFMYEMIGNPGSFYQYPELIELRYPKPGTTNPTVKLTVRDLSNGEMDIPAPISKVSEDHILGNVAWMTNNVLIVTWTNRRQQIGSIQKCTISTTVACEEIIALSTPNGWIETFKIHCVTDVPKCFFIDNVGNWPHIKSFGTNGVAQIETQGDMTVQSILGYDSINSNL